MLPSIFIIPSELLLFPIEIIKALYCYITKVLLFHVLRSICKLRFTHSAGLTIVNKDVLPFKVVFCYCYMIV